MVAIIKEHDLSGNYLQTDRWHETHGQLFVIMGDICSEPTSSFVFCWTRFDLFRMSYRAPQSMLSHWLREPACQVRTNKQTNKQNSRALVCASPEVENCEALCQKLERYFNRQFALSGCSYCWMKSQSLK